MCLPMAKPGLCAFLTRDAFLLHFFFESEVSLPRERVSERSLPCTISGAGLGGDMWKSTSVRGQPTACPFPLAWVVSSTHIQVALTRSHSHWAMPFYLIISISQLFLTGDEVFQDGMHPCQRSSLLCELKMTLEVSPSLHSVSQPEKACGGGRDGKTHLGGDRVG